MLDKETFDEILKEENKLIIVDFFADWCMPCKMLSPIYEKVSENYTDVVFCKINIDSNTDIVTKYEIDSVPTMLFIKNGNVINQEIGVRSETELKGLVEKFK